MMKSSIFDLRRQRLQHLIDTKAFAQMGYFDELIRIAEDEDESERKHKEEELKHKEEERKHKVEENAAEVALMREQNRKRELELEYLKEQQKIPRASSPQKSDVIYILCDDPFNPVGTCFAVKDKNHHNYHVVTAFHNLRPHPRNQGDIYYLAKQFTRHSTGFVVATPLQLIEVKLEAWDEKFDWAILTRTDLTPFADCIEVRTTPCHAEDKVKTYHYPVSLFTQQDKTVCTVLHCCIASWSKVHYVDGPILNAETGLAKGSSGGAMVDGDGKAVAIYISAISSVDVTAKGARAIAINAVENPMTMKEGLVIAFTPGLRDYFV